jgi:hypothetical protein
VVSSGIDPRVANSIAFAIPITVFHGLADLNPLEWSGEPRIIRLPSLGVMYYNSSESCVDYGNTVCENGVMVQWVSKNSALHGSLQTGNRICSVSYEEKNSAQPVEFNVDNYGDVVVPWYNSKIPLPHAVATIPYGTPIRLTFWGQNRAESLDNIVLKPSLSGGFLEVYEPFETLDYEVFGGVVVMPLRLRHVMGFPWIKYKLEPSELENDHLIISYVIPHAKFAEINVLMPGDILRRVNDRDVYTMDDYREALRHPLGSDAAPTVQSSTSAPPPKLCVKWENWDRQSEELLLQNILTQEPDLSQALHYPLSKTYQHFVPTQSAE